MIDGILEQLSKYNLIGDMQPGFISKRYSLTNLLEFLEVATNYIDQGLPVDVVYLDLWKVFLMKIWKRLPTL
jgi:hypothetical protein